MQSGSFTDAVLLGILQHSVTRPFHALLQTYLITSLLCITLLLVLPMNPVTAQERTIQLPAGVELSQEEKQAFKEQFRTEQRQRRKESTVAMGNQHSAMITANCIEGYVKKAQVNKSVPDVEIVAEQGVVCDDGGCQGWQVQAKSESDALFDIEIRLLCSQEDWLVIETAPE